MWGISALCMRCACCCFCLLRPTAAASAPYSRLRPRSSLLSFYLSVFLQLALLVVVVAKDLVTPHHSIGIHIAIVIATVLHHIPLASPIVPFLVLPLPHSLHHSLPTLDPHHLHSTLPLHLPLCHTPLEPPTSPLTPTRYTDRARATA